MAVDFSNLLFKLTPINVSEVRSEIHTMLIDGEEIFAALKSNRDQCIFTTKRVISVNVQGITGAKVDYTSMPYSKVQAYAIETAGSLDRDCELDLWFSGLAGRVRFEIRGNFDLIGFSKLISELIL